MEQMGTLSPPRGKFLPILIGVLVLQGMVGLVPHRHDMATVRTGGGMADHWCSHGTAEAFPVAEVHAPPPCLACVVETPAFNRPGGVPNVVFRRTTTAVPVSPNRFATVSRRWCHRLRAPPSPV